MFDNRDVAAALAVLLFVLFATWVFGGPPPERQEMQAEITRLLEENRKLKAELAAIKSRLHAGTVKQTLTVPAYQPAVQYRPPAMFAPAFSQPFAGANCVGGT